jgi:hypothetical protein
LPPLAAPSSNEGPFCETAVDPRCFSESGRHCRGRRPWPPAGAAAPDGFVAGPKADQRRSKGVAPAHARQEAAAVEGHEYAPAREARGLVHEAHAWPAVEAEAHVSPTAERRRSRRVCRRLSLPPMSPTTRSRGTSPSWANSPSPVKVTSPNPSKVSRAASTSATRHGAKGAWSPPPGPAAGARRRRQKPRAGTGR